MEDETLVKGLRERNEQALSSLILVYGGLIKSIVHRHLNSFEAYQDECVNDILFALWNNISQYDETKNSFKNWIGAVSKYKCIDYKRKYYRRMCEEPIDERIPSDNGADKELLAREISEETESLLACLSAEDKALFWDSYVEQIDMKALAERHKMKPAVIYNRLSRGRKRMKTGCFKE